MMSSILFVLIAAAAAPQPPADLVITAPAADTVVAPGTSVVVSVNSPSGITFSAIMLVAEQPIGLSPAATSLPAQWTIAVPAQLSLGRYPITAVGTTAAGVTLHSEPIHIHIERPDAPARIVPLMDSITLNATGEMSPIALSATFANGMSADVTQSSRVTYSTSDALIAGVNEEGLVTAGAPGSATITARYVIGTSALAVEIPVVVRQPALTPSRYAVAFGEQPVGSPSPGQQMTLTNTGAGPLLVRSLETAGDFSLSTDCPIDVALPPGASCTATVTFRPTTAGARRGTLEILTSAHAVPAGVPLSGTATGVADGVAPVTTSDVQPAPTAGGWHNAGVTVALTATDAGAGATGVEQITYSAAGAQTIPSTTSAGATAAIAMTTEGSTTLTFFATDRAGNVEPARTLAVKLDKSAPVVHCGTADAVWRASNVTIPCTASDAVSGLLNPSDAAVSLATAVPAGTETVHAETGSHRICDAAANCVTAGPVTGIAIDRRGPSIAIAIPTDGGSYTLGQVIPAAYSCADGGSGIAGCTGPVPSGAPLETGTVGGKTLVVNALDAVGNPATASVPYSVVYASGACRGEPARQILAPIRADGTTVVKRGSTLPVKFRVCDAGGASIGTDGVVRSFVLVSSQIASEIEEVNTPVSSTTPDTTFRWDPGAQQWIFNLRTDSLVPDSVNRYRITLDDGTAIEFRFKVR